MRIPPAYRHTITERRVEVENVLNAVRVTSSTLIGVSKDKYPLTHGNCFSVLADDGKEYNVVNFVYENLKEVCRRGILFPISIRALSDRVAVLHDARIPDEWYSVRFCEICCPISILPLPQRLAHERQKMTGARIERKDSVIYDFSKIPNLKDLT